MSLRVVNIHPMFLCLLSFVTFTSEDGYAVVIVPVTLYDGRVVSARVFQARGLLVKPGLFLLPSTRCDTCP